MSVYKSPDAKSTWSFVLDVAVFLSLTAAAVLNAFSGHTAAVVLLVGFLLLNELGDIHTEVRASRRLAELATLRRVR